jgi:hypothetical protein
MTQWDDAASAHLRTVAADLREVGIARMLEEQVRAVWRRNVDGHDPLLGDTSLSLGIDCSENLRELVVRNCAGDGSVWRRRGVAASVTDRSLRLDVAGVRLGLMKAPPSPARTPEWTASSFHWEQESDVRRTAAERNSSAYRPCESDQADRQLILAVEVKKPAATEMRDLLVVWSGQVEPALTAGWLGLPSLGRPGWFAVELLWWDEPGEDGARRRDEDLPSDGESFADLPAPQPSVTLKNRRDVAGGQSRS